AIAAQQLVDVLPGLDGPEVSTLTAAVLKSAEVDPAAAISLLQHAAGHTTNESAADLVHLALALPVENLRDQSELYQALADGFGTARIVPPVEFQKWSERLAIQIFEDVSPDDVSWGQYQWNGKPVLNWGFEPRLPRPGAAAKAEFLSSLPGGERAVGVLRSRPFVLPLELKIEVCGHLGFPDQSPSPDNRVVLRDFETGSELASILPPRNDTAATTELNLAGTNGRKGYLEIIDGLDLRAYAWLAVGRISPPVVKAADFDGGFASEQLAAAVRILAHRHDNKAPLSPSETDRLKQIVMAIQLDGPTRRLAAEALLKIRDLPEEYLSLPLLLEEATLPRPVDQLIVDVCVNDKITLPESRVVKSVPTEAEPTSLQTESSPTSTDVFRLIFAQIDQHLRTLLSTRMATQRHSAEMLMTLMESGVPSAQLLRDQRLAQQLSGFDDQFAKRISSLISSLPPVVDGTQQLAASLLTRLKLEDGDPSEGQRLFTKHCSACHRRAGQGGIAGPQLDGIGTRGPSRLIEDILQPNQNVDIAFRTSVVVMKDGRVLTGLLKDGGRDDEKLLIATDGKSQTISTNDIEETRLSNLSLMPANLATQITPDEFLHLIAWLSH
ncbi:MAG: c-type cytochrome, partial [Planctomycetaceae bacterium]|nr:c-type cytochrome [Planctomycetaceae bacterium]